MSAGGWWPPSPSLCHDLTKEISNHLRGQRTMMPFRRKEDCDNIVAAESKTTTTMAKTKTTNDYKRITEEEEEEEEEEDRTIPRPESRS